LFLVTSVFALSTFCLSFPPHRASHSFPTRRSSDLSATSSADAPDEASWSFDFHPPDYEDNLLIWSDRIDRVAAREYATPCRAYEDRKSTRLNSSHVKISYAVFCLKKKKAVVRLN